MKCITTHIRYVLSEYTYMVKPRAYGIARAAEDSRKTGIGDGVVAAAAYNSEASTPSAYGARNTIVLA